MDEGQFPQPAERWIWELGQRTKTQDLSVLGAFILDPPDSVRAGDELAVHIDRAGEMITFSAVAVRTGPNGVGVRFVRVPPEVKKRMRAFLRQQSPTNAAVPAGSEVIS